MNHIYASVLLLFLFSSLNSYAAKPPKDRISEKKARDIATQTYSGPIKSSELEFEHGHWVYSFDIAGNDKLTHEVLVDAKTGKVLGHTTETPAQEQAEKNAEQGK